MHQPEKILIIRFSSLGDIVLLTCLFRETKKCFPHTKIDFVTSSEFAPLVDNNPHLNQVFFYDRKKKDKSEWKKLTKILSSQNYEIILDAHHSIRSRLLLFQIPKKYSQKRIRIDKRSLKRDLLILFKFNLLKKFTPQREAYLALLSKFTTLGKKEAWTEIFPGEKEQTHVKKIIKKYSLLSKPLIAIGAGASFTGKAWPKEYYLELIQSLSIKNYNIILLGGKDDEASIWLKNNIKSESVFLLAGELNYLESVEMIRHCVLTVSNDSAIVHFSEAVKVPAIAIFGPTVKEFGFGPFLEESQLLELSLPCRPCSRNGKGKCSNPNYRECLYSLSPEYVIQETLHTLKSQRNKSL